MPFNHNAFRTLQERRGFTTVGEPNAELACDIRKQFSRDIRKQTGETISRLSFESWELAEQPRPPTTRQLDILYKYAAKTDNSDLKFYTSP